MRMLTWLQHIDRRIMYLLLVVVIAIPLIWGANLPIVVSPAVQGAYDTIEHIPSNKIAILSIIWDSGTIAENRPQTEALIRHMFMKNKKFAILAFAPQGSKFAYDIATDLGKQYGKVYGRDWVHWGYKPVANFVMLLKSFPRDVKRSISKDIHGTALSRIPMMRNVNTIKDVGAIVDITPSGTLDYWIAFVYGPYRTPLIYSPTAVMAPEGFNPLDAGQIKGIIIGMKGAAEYEHLLGRSDFATRGAGALSASHILIVVLIILGNIGYVVSRRAREH